MDKLLYESSLGSVHQLLFLIKTNFEDMFSDTKINYKNILLNLLRYFASFNDL